MSKSPEVVALEPEARRALSVVFLTLFIDLVGFSVVFPLFPDMLEYYGGGAGGVGSGADAGGAFAAFQRIVNAVLGLVGADPADRSVHIVFFGGILGSLYGLLQYVFTPIWGGLSDRWGRKPVLTICIAGLAISNVMWVFASSFGMFLASRVLGGIMAGNISAATAAVADVTSPATRSRGMALVGMAFGLGFLCGPAIGGLLATIDVSDPGVAPGLLGLNPFSVPAAFAAALAILNLILLKARFRETLSAATRGLASHRTLNPFAVFELRAYVGAFRAVITNFFYVTIFSGMEFTLVFLAAERLQYGNAERGLLFVFVGVIIALVQGGYVRRRAREVGEKRMALQGMALSVPGLLLVGFADTTALLLVGLGFLSVGSALAMPCLTALVSLFAPPEDQGRVVGIFRSLGSLGRAVGPIIAGALYWKCGATLAYAIGSALMLIPVIVGFGLPSDGGRDET